MQFRQDINGLRAIAVLAVILFHFNPSLLPGGFAGVDVFFVISGFLMTKIIFSGLDKNTFTVKRFYSARVTRIIPPLVALCLTLMVFGWFYLTPADYGVLGKHISSSIGFVSNITYLKESGYFDSSSHEKWLLHTWSLSAEWQFYLIYPLILMLMKKVMSIHNIKRVVVFLTFISFTHCVLSTVESQSYSFYSLPTRAWEMFLGGIAYLYPWRINKGKKVMTEYAGIIMILLSYALISEEVMWPGYMALLPAIGAFLVIQSHRNDSMLTNNVIFQKIGSWSYSVYLWHWPLVVYLSYESKLQDVNYQVLFILLSIGLGYLSYRYIEGVKFSVKYILSSAVIILLLSLYVKENLPNQVMYPAIPDSLLNSIKLNNYDCFDQSETAKPLFCKMGQGNNKVLAIGDSHLNSLLPVLDTIANIENIDLTYAGYSGCPPVLLVHSLRKDQQNKSCHQLNEEVLEYALNNQIDTVLLIARWTYYTHGDYTGKKPSLLALDNIAHSSVSLSTEALKAGLRETFKRYSDNGINVILLLQVPMQEAKPNDIYFGSLSSTGIDLDMLHNNSITQKKHESFQFEINAFISEEANRYSNIKVLDPKDAFCNGTSCPVGTNKESYYYDDDHVSPAGSHKLESLIIEELEASN